MISNPIDKEKNLVGSEPKGTNQGEVRPAAAVETADGRDGKRTLDCDPLMPGNNSGMALSVTRHAATPRVEGFKFLLGGIDTLDLGLYVEWGSGWKSRLRSLDKKKQRAREKGGLLIGMPSGRNCIFLPGGKGQNYRFHIRFEAYNLFIGKAALPGSTPNAYLSISAKTLWLHGIETALSWIKEDLKTIGQGTIRFVQVSRADLCADFLIPGGLSYDFLYSHKVTRNDKSNLYTNKKDLETYYAADAKSPIQLRIYNKGLEVKKEGTKLWFLDLWQRESTEDVWRFEYQLRRPALKQFGIDSLDDLKEKQAGVWDYLTSKWFSLRIPDDEKAERRTVHSLWSAIQGCFKPWNPGNEVKRIYRSETTAPLEWYLSHIDGNLSSFAARLGITNRKDALQELERRLTRRNDENEFEAASIKKAIQRGTLNDGGGR